LRWIKAAFLPAVFFPLGNPGTGLVLYFFHIFEGGVAIPDLEGTDLPSWEAAQEEAAAIVRELVREFPGRFGRSSVLEVSLACGKRVMALPIREAMSA
jgi:hypothetical protein